MTTITSPRGTPSQVTEAAQPVPASPLDAEDLRARVDRALAALLDRELTALGFLGEDAGAVTDALTRFALEGGKRLRPAFVWWGYRGAGGPATGPEADATILASCSVELLHICALIHDDIMDGSEVRRGRPAMHVGFAGLHRGRGWRGDPAAFGEGAAMLMGDLAFTWADVALVEAGLADPRLAAAYSAYGLPLGEAFQLRDDILGVFGSPEVTGKPAGDDLREGKETYLVMLARQRADGAGRRLLDGALGNAKLSEDEVADLRRLITDCGAVEATEARIAELLAQAKATLAAAGGIDETARAALSALADHVTDRSA